MKICSRLHASFQRRGHRTAAVRAALPLALAALAIIATGCSSSVERRADAWGGEGTHTSKATAARSSAPSQGGSWELVFQSPSVAAHADGPEYARRDASLNPRGNEPLTALSDWPEAPRADLSRSRSIRVRDSESTFIYYFPSTDHRGGHRHSGHSFHHSSWWY